MAEEEPIINSLNEPDSSSKDIQEERDEGCLQLSIGSHTTTHSNVNKHDLADPTA
jgi:hypothetical protein